MKDSRGQGFKGFIPRFFLFLEPWNLEASLCEESLRPGILEPLIIKKRK